MPHTLKPFQQQAIDSLKTNAHTILIAATGSGKSLIFERFLSEFKSSTRAVLVCPLNALARQHEQALRALGLNVSQGVGKESKGPPEGPGVWILNPEKIMGRYAAQIREWAPNFLIVDEAHCVWEWGRQFRPEFALLPAWANSLRIKKTFWCTATLPPQGLAVLKSEFPAANLLGQFKLPETLLVRKLRAPPHARVQLLRSLLEERRANSGMIFVLTRKASDRLLEFLKFWNIPALSYHAGMSHEERLNLERAMSIHQKNKETVWVVATSAFGMGMNYPFLKNCILFEPSFNLLALAQALGRVGRGGAQAEAFVLWHDDDFQRHLWHSNLSAENRSDRALVEAWCKNNEGDHDFLEKYFNGGFDSGKVEMKDEYSIGSAATH